MQLFISSLNSGSNGNCYYIGNAQEAILVDAGLSCRETEKRMQRLELSLNKVKAIFISHEHSDHIRGVAVLAKKYNLPVFISPNTLQHLSATWHNVQAMPLLADTPISIGGLSVTAFSKLHDACDPHSFVVRCGNVTIGVFTDIGTPCANLMYHFAQCHAAFLEANYDDEMLDRGSYPYHLKRRIRGGKGHLSNKQAVALFTTHKPAFMSHVLLAHLSKNNNCPQLVQDIFSTEAGATEVVVASRYAETPVYTISHQGNKYGHPQKKTKVAEIPPAPLQLSLF